MIDINKQYRTRDGREVRIYATDGEGNTIHGAILTVAGWAVRAWRSDGRRTFHDDAEDLIEVRPRHKRTMWVNVYTLENGESIGSVLWPTKETADTVAIPRIACIKIELDFEEGEGL